MFLHKLYRFNKVLFFLFVAFLATFLFINVKQGAVITPVYQYGMFSEPFYLRDPRWAYSVSLDGNQLSLAKYSFPTRDIILVSLDHYLESRTRNLQVYKALSPLMNPLLTLPANLSQSASPADFNKWYAEMVSGLINQEVKQLEVYRKEIVWTGLAFVQKNSKKIFPIAE